jgi:hypothetical protein
LQENLSALHQNCTNFKDRVTQLLGQHKRNRRTLQCHMQLVELLEVPQLVDACARNGFHEEALELASFINSLVNKLRCCLSTCVCDKFIVLTGSTCVIVAGEKTYVGGGCQARNREQGLLR